uniref:DNA-directed RNA polymerase RpoA/D/Rpb3-type domain-containing protein n=1 Tax=Brassica campestris TaxID=3711 RepID=M4FGX3_BRACM
MATKEGEGEVKTIVTEEEKTFTKNFNIMDLPEIPTGLPPHLQLPLAFVSFFGLEYQIMGLTASVVYSGAYNGVGVDNTIANAFRRILLAELSTMAFEKVFIANNTSIVQDEVIAQRMGLVPIAADPKLFEYISENDQPNEKNTIVFKLHTKCAKSEGRKKGDSNSKPKTYTSFIRSQEESFPEFTDNPITPSYPDILIAKLSPGHEIEPEAHAVKGIGKTHAKWSPVATAWEVEDEDAERLVEACPVKVFDIEDLGNGRNRERVARPRNCTLCMQCMRENYGEEVKGEGKQRKKWIENVALRRVKNHFIFKIESTGSLPPDVLFTEAVKILEDKCERVIANLS